MSGSPWFLALLGAVVEVGGGGTCPSPARVADLLRQLSPGLSEGPTRLRAELTEVETGLHVRLLAPDGREVAHRQLSGSPSCEERAAAVSVMLLAWAQELEAGGALESPAVSPLPSEDLPGAATERLEAPPESGPRLLSDVTLGLSASLGGRQVALGGLLSGGLTSGTSGLGGHLTLAALGTRHTASERATYERFAAALTPHYRLPLPLNAVDLNAGGALGVFVLVPEVGRGSAAVEPGVTAGVRVLGAGALWAGLQGYFWPVVQALPGGERAPRGEVVAAAGLSWSGP
jgi:hypothetical protein